MKTLIFAVITLLTAQVFAAAVGEKASCSLSKIDQGYPRVAIPSIGVVEFSKTHIKIPVQHYNRDITTWQTDLAPAANGTLSGKHVWDVRTVLNAEGKIERLTLNFEDPTNLGLVNEESTFAAEFYCTDTTTPQMISQSKGEKLFFQVANRMVPKKLMKFYTPKVELAADGCSLVFGYEVENEICEDEDQYVGASLSLKVCNDTVVFTNLRCQPY